MNATATWFECGRESKCWYLEFCLVFPILYLLQSEKPELGEGVRARFGISPRVGGVHVSFWAASFEL